MRPESLPSDEVAAVGRCHEAYTRLRDELAKVIVGQHEVIEQVLVAMLAQGHALLEGVSGLAKTLLVSSLARALDLSYKRIQFTPDLMPSDVTGTEVIQEDPQTHQRAYRFLPGPVFANLLLADEINRTPPKTQAAMLEAMQERQVSAGGHRHPLPRPFFVLATQNPLEQEGTYPLPEAQLDRFLMRISLGYPNRDDEIAVLDAHRLSAPIDSIEQVIDTAGLLQIQEAVKHVHVDRAIKEYIVALSEATRRHPEVYLGASPRGSLALQRTAQARALLAGRSYVTPDDIKALAEPTLAHRLIISPSARIKNVSARAVVAEIVESVPVPGAQVRSG
ncbi:MAG: MoxR family ATPase [Dehalococcoidia bacterium]|nr:MoxR family ATPase [Dehalococcoidia bacterium]